MPRSSIQLEKTSKANKLVGLEIGRGIAASIVVLYHVARILEPYAQVSITPLDFFQFGHAGVDFFFVLSGFIIFYVHQKHIGNAAYLPIYFWRRVTRIYPIYWVAALAAMCTIILKGENLPDLTDITHSILLMPGQYTPLVGVAWTLVAEVQFYLIFGILILNRWAGIALVIIWQTAVISSLFGQSFATESSVSMYHLQFLMGIVAAHYALKLQDVPKYILPISIAVFGAVSIMENITMIDGYGEIARLLYGIPSMGILIGLADPNIKWRYGKLLRLMSLLGASTYSVYLFHLFFIGLLFLVLKTLIPGILAHVWLLYFPTVLISIAGGVIVSKLIELPVLRYTKSIYPKRDHSAPR